MWRCCSERALQSLGFLRPCLFAVSKLQIGVGKERDIYHGSPSAAHLALIRHLDTTTGAEIMSDHAFMEPTRAQYECPCYTMSAWACAAMEPPAHQVYSRVHVQPCTPEHARAHAHAEGSRRSHVSPYNPDRHGPRWA